MRIFKPGGVALAAALMLAACGTEGGQTANAQGPVLEVYDVPPAQLIAVEQALSGVLRADQTGSVSRSDGRLLVLAPPAIQESLGEAIDTLGTPPAESEGARDTPIRLRFWLVAGTSDPAPADPRVEALRPALDAASQGLGLQGYRLQGFTEVLASHAQGFDSATSNLVIRGGSRLAEAGITLDVDMDMKQTDDDWDARIQTRVLMDPGEFLVLGTSAAEDGSMRLVVVQAMLPGNAP